MTVLTLGTCSWKFPSWVDLVYEPDLVAQRRPNYLQAYARRFPTVEVDQWFWSLFGEAKIALPRTDQVAEYLTSVPESFRFTVKVSNAVTLTHFYKKVAGTELEPNPYFYSPTLFADFAAALGGLAARTDALLFQFEYLNKKKMAGRSEFLTRTGDFLAGVDRPAPLAFESRNPNYLDEEYFSFLKEHDIAPVFSQGYYLPDIRDLYGRFGHLVGDLAVIRLLGPDREGIEKDTGKEWNSVVRPKDDEIPGIVDLALDLLGRGVRVIVNVNNHYEGSAPITIAKLEDALRDRGREVVNGRVT